MTNISISKLIPITSSTVNGSFTGVELSGMFLTTSNLLPINTTSIATSFSTLEAVGNYFGTGSSEYSMASNYFNSYINSIKGASKLFFGRRVTAAASAFIRSGTTPVLSTIQAIVAGAITFNFNGGTQVLAALNFSTDTSFSLVATRIQTALQVSIPTATVTYNSNLKAFIASDGLVTGTSTITASAVTTLSTALGFTTATAAVLSQGSPILTVAANMTLITAVTKNWAGLSTVYDAASTAPYTEALAISSWVNDQNNMYGYICWSQEAALLVLNNIAATIMGQLTTLNYANTFVIYGTNAHAGFIAGIGASIDYRALNGTISFAGKMQSGLAASADTDAEYDALTSNNVNYYGAFAARASTYTFSETGQMLGQFKWLDNLYNQIWLADAVQNTVATLFQNVGKLPNNINGYQTLKSALNTAMQSSVKNGVSQTGNTFDATTKNILQNQAGYDITPLLTSRGYVIQIVPVTSAQRAARTPPVTNIWYTNGGSINNLPINVTYVF
jgi:hypothetical protein